MEKRRRLGIPLCFREIEFQTRGNAVAIGWTRPCMLIAKMGRGGFVKSELFIWKIAIALFSVLQVGSK